VLFDPTRGEMRRTWCLVMTPRFSRHQCVEFVGGQSAATWLGCHRRAFDWFGAVPARLIIDNPSVRSQGVQPRYFAEAGRQVMETH
jgi:transposase